ncbi:hypothetical protein BGX24_003515 [Mortierella sp. AD032]|nr:hypothetical protein BGX24_003515 [Mortierella sp. AD032]
MTFHHSSEDIRLENNSILFARCRKADGSWNDSSHTAENVRLDLSREGGPIIEADLRSANGAIRKGECIFLGERIQNENGDLTLN